MGAIRNKKNSAACVTAPERKALVMTPAGTLAELVENLGSIPLERIRLQPPPGTATEQDVLAQSDGVKRLCELMDGVLVEKPLGFFKSRLAVVLGYFLEDFLTWCDLGIVLGAAATLRLRPGLV